MIKTFNVFQHILENFNYLENLVRSEEPPRRLEEPSQQLIAYLFLGFNYRKKNICINYKKQSCGSVSF